MQPVAIVRRGSSGAVASDALQQEGIPLVEVSPGEVSSLGSGARRDVRVLIVPGPLEAESIEPLRRFRSRGGAVVLLGGDLPAGLLLELTGARALPHAVSGGHLWASSPDLLLPAIAPDRPLQITGRRRLYAASPGTETLALGSALPSAAVALDANRDGFIDDEWYFMGPSISMTGRGRPSVQELVIPGLGPFCPTAAAAGDYTGDGFADDVLVASGDTFAVLRKGAWSEPRRAPAEIRHVLSHPGQGPRWVIHLFLGDGSSYVTSLDGGATFGQREVFAPSGVKVASDLSYSFDYIDLTGARRTGLHVWSGGFYHADLGHGWGPPIMADLGPRYLGANVVRPGLGFCSDEDRKGLRDRWSLLVGDNLYRMDPATGSFDYPISVRRRVGGAKDPLVVRRERAVAFLFDFEQTVQDLQQGRMAPTSHVEPVISAFDDWVDYTAWDLPQADLHERLLRQAVLGLLGSPLPRLWYWPTAVRSVASISHDVETTELGRPDIVRQCTMDLGRRSAAEGRRDTFFVLSEPDACVLDRGDIAELLRQGHCAALHYDPLRAGAFSAEQVRSQAARLRALGAPAVTGNRTHGLAWQQGAAPRAIAALPGLVFDSTFGGGPGFSHGGSVFPYRLRDERGEAFSSFEEIPHALMDVADATLYFSGIAPPGRLVMSVAELLERARSLVRKNDEAFHGVIDCLFHPAVVAGLSPPIEAFLPAAAELARFLREQDIASMTLLQIAEWWRLRRGLCISGGTMSRSGELTFSLEAAEPVASATIVLPLEHDGRALGQIRAGGEPLSWREELIDGSRTAMLELRDVQSRINLSARYAP